MSTVYHLEFIASRIILKNGGRRGCFCGKSN
jgi:hypothetical protein